jgi:hypothetical protein
VSVCIYKSPSDSSLSPKSRLGTEHRCWLKGTFVQYSFSFVLKGHYFACFFTFSFSLVAQYTSSTVTLETFEALSLAAFLARSAFFELLGIKKQEIKINFTIIRSLNHPQFS